MTLLALTDTAPFDRTRRDPEGHEIDYGAAPDGAMRPPLPVGFRMQTNCRRGRRPTGICNKRAVVRGSVIARRHSAGSRSANLG